MDFSKALSRNSHVKYRARITEALYSGRLSDIYVNEKQTVLRGREATPSPARQSKAIYRLHHNTQHHCIPEELCPTF